MHLVRTGLLAILLALTTIRPSLAQDRPDPRNFVFLGGDAAADHAALIARPDIEGAQIVYSWRQLEPREGEYDFSAIEADLATLDALDAVLFVQLQDRFFSAAARRLPDYLLTEPRYGGGLARQYDNPGEGEPVGHGWTAMQWNDALRARFQALIAALGERFDGRLYGINLPETAFDRVEGSDPQGFTCDAYFDAALDNMRALRAAFTKTQVVQYVNFWPCEWNNDHRYMERVFVLAAAEGIGMGGPDIVPHRPGQMRNSYPFFHWHHDALPLVAMAVQEPTLTYTNPQTGERFTREDFVAFARDYLGVDIIFWSARAPWLAE
ncbi:hypothetical protein [Stakelama tenebrarum]|uniref:Uncharacterized protein n=1 Tax=Stakelama tenebrarum TaxID=2711215 RepID=A0A6G6Y8S6_9SPHN|nr:hypothetical protein [Sphingosinithalassobacter tenebrarum]QIG81118.1 hypothetical protein G5C33_15920 [Sphingosinithalassobacter tenebrarum]